MYEQGRKVTLLEAQDDILKTTSTVYRHAAIAKICNTSIDTPIVATRYYAIASGTFAVLATETLSQEAIDAMCGDDEYKRGIYKKGYACGARIINPFGKKISAEEFAHDEEGIAYGDIDLSVLAEAKYHMDCAGHYSKGSVASIRFNLEPQDAVRFIGEESDYGITYESLQQ